MYRSSEQYISLNYCIITNIAIRLFKHVLSTCTYTKYLLCIIITVGNRDADIIRTEGT